MEEGFYGIGIEPVNSWFDKNDNDPESFQRKRGISCYPNKPITIKY